MKHNPTYKILAAPSELSGLILAIVSFLFLSAQSIAQINNKPSLMSGIIKPRLTIQPVPVSLITFLQKKRELKRTDSLNPESRKDNLAAEAQELTDKRVPHLYDQAGRNDESVFPGVYPFYFKLSGFTGVSRDSIVYLHWQSDINENVRYFLIEKSVDRKNFFLAGEISLSGKSNIKDFSFTDTAYQNQSVYYYQVKALLSDGSSMTSDFIPVKNGAAELKVSLVPAIEKDILILSSNKPLKKIEIINIEGQVIFKKKNVNPEEKINISHYEPGSYALKVFGEDGFVTQLFIRK